MARAAYARAGSTVPALAEADARIARLHAFGAHEDLVAVLQEGALLAHGSSIGVLPPWVSSSSEPASAGSGPDSVPVPSMSPGCRLQPLTVWCVISCATFQ